MRLPTKENAGNTRSQYICEATVVPTRTSCCVLQSHSLRVHLVSSMTAPLMAQVTNP